MPLSFLTRSHSATGTSSTDLPMHTSLRLGSVLLLAATTAFAQTNLGILNRTDTSFTSRGSNAGANTNPCFVIEKLDKEYYAGWGVDPANPGMRQILGFHTWIQDQVGNTPETFGIRVFPEAAAANFPNVAAPLATAGPFPTPTSTVTTAISWEMSVNFTTPVLAPATSDVFLGLDLPQPLTGAWPTDGLSCWALYYVAVSSGISDLPGTSHPTAPPEEVGNGSYYVPLLTLGPSYTVTPRMWKIEPIVAGAAGIAGTITNQTTAPSSNVAPGTSSQASGLHPDAQSPSLNTGRADDIASRWFKAGTLNGTPVFFMMDLGTFGPELPVSGLLPGSTGVVCLNLPSLVVIGIGFTTTGEAFMTLPIPASARLFIAGTSLLHQSAAFDPATGVAHANGCTRQVL